MRIAITGHRPDKLGNDYDLTSPLIKEISIKLVNIIINIKPSQMISGMAQGIDTLWAELALEFKVPLMAVIPCLDQEKVWPEKAQIRYRHILANPLTKFVMITHEPFRPNCMQKRNEWMVNNCDLLVAVWDGTPGGTANCVNFAHQQGRKIITINPKNIVMPKPKKPVIKPKPTY